MLYVPGVLMLMGAEVWPPLPETPIAPAVVTLPLVGHVLPVV